MEDKDFLSLNIKGFKKDLPLLTISKGIRIAFLNLHGDQELTEHCAKEISKLVEGCDIILTAESKGIQLAHCVARNLEQRYYCVARKSKKLYMQDGIEVVIKSSITTGTEQKLYISAFDAELMKGKKVAIVDDVVSTGHSLQGLEEMVKLAGGEVYKKAFVLAEGRAKNRDDILFLDTIDLY